MQFRGLRIGVALFKLGFPLLGLGLGFRVHATNSKRLDITTFALTDRFEVPAVLLLLHRLSRRVGGVTVKVAFP